MRKILYGLAALVAVIVAALFALPFFIDSEAVRERVETEVEKRTGRALDIRGPFSVRALPMLEARAEDVSLANPPSFGDEPFATLGSLNVRLKLWPLLSGRIELDEFILEEPAIRLERRANGEANWVFEPEAAPAQAPAPDDQGGGGQVPDIALGDVRLVDGVATYVDAVTGASHQITGANLRISLESLSQPLSIAGALQWDGQPFSMDATLSAPRAFLDGGASDLAMRAGGDLGEMRFEGAVQGGERIGLDGGFEARAPDLPAALAFFGLDRPEAAALGRVSVSGRIEGVLGALALSELDLNHEGGLFTARYQGAARLGDSVSLDGAIDAGARDAAQLLTVLGISTPVDAALGEVNAKARIQGSPDAMTLTGVELTHASPLLDASFFGEGRATGQGVTFSGQADAKAKDLRRLAEATGTALPPGDDIFRRADISGRLSGSSAKVDFENAQVAFDDIAGTGRLSLDLSRAKPNLTGQLSLEDVDATPYLAAQTGETGSGRGGSSGEQQWSEEPLDLAALKSFNALIKADVASVTYQRYRLGRTDAELKVSDGLLTIDLQEINLYDGGGAAKITVDARPAEPKVALFAELEKVQAQPLLSAAAGFERLLGKGELFVDVEGQGASQAEIMRSLTGKGRFLFDEGLIEGLNLDLATELASQWRRGETFDQSALPTLVATLPRKLEVTGGAKGTPLERIRGGFKLANGVAETDNFTITTPYGTIDAGGVINLGEQSVRFSFYPLINTSAVPQLAELNLGELRVPVTYEGPWYGIGAPRIDLASAFQAKIEDRLRGAIAGQLGGALGLPNGGAAAPGGEGGEEAAPADPEDVLRGVLGGVLRDQLGGASPTPTPTSTPTGSPTPSPSPSPDEEEEEEARSPEEELLRGLLGGVLREAAGGKEEDGGGQEGEEGQKDDGAE